MTRPGVMGIPSKPAYRSGRNAPTRRQVLYAQREKVPAVCSYCQGSGKNANGPGPCPACLGTGIKS